MVISTIHRGTHVRDKMRTRKCTCTDDHICVYTHTHTHASSLSQYSYTYKLSLSHTHAHLHMNPLPPPPPPPPPPNTHTHTHTHTVTHNEGWRNSLLPGAQMPRTSRWKFFMAPPPFPAHPTEVKTSIHSSYRLRETKFNAFQEQVFIIFQGLNGGGGGGGGIKMKREEKRLVDLQRNYHEHGRLTNYTELKSYSGFGRVSNSVLYAQWTIMVISGWDLAEETWTYTHGKHKCMHMHKIRELNVGDLW